MASFIATMAAVADEKSKKNAVSLEKDSVDKNHRYENKKDELMIFLTEKYHGSVKRAIHNASQKGKREKYINFCYDDFKANMNGFGNPKAVQAIWLDEMTNPLSKYLPVNEDTGEKEHFVGLNWNIWGNSVFTTYFTW